MPDRDWSLVLFTTLAQWSAGIVLLLSWSLFSNSGPVFATVIGAGNPVLLALMLIAVATLSSFLHLGNPANAPKALNNLAGSWLSREILAIAVFSLSLVMALVTGWLCGAGAALQYLLALSALCGLALLWMMARIYLVPTIPAWNNWHTPVSFVLTALNLGLCSLLVFQAAGMARIDDVLVNGLMTALMLTLFATTAAGLLHQLQLQKLNSCMHKPVFDRGPFFTVFVLRMSLLLSAFLMIFYVLIHTALLPESDYSTWLYALGSLVLAEEIAGRFLFYAAYFRIGV